MSCSPTTGISRLSLEDLPSAIRSQQYQMQASRQEGFGEPHGEGDDSMDEDGEGTVQSPTKLKYNLDHLSPDTQKLVRSLWGETFEEPPQISLQWCDRMLDKDGNLDFYAFQLHEVVPRSVRIGSPKSKFPEPECQCNDRQQPCKHVIWLSDCIARQVLHDHDPREPLTLNARGYPNELGEPLFQSISDMRLDILADGLHCDVGHPLSRNSPSPQKVADAQAIVASIAEADEHVFDSYRSDLSAPEFKSSQLVHRKDAEATLFSLLLASHRLSTWLRSGLRPSDPPQNPFRQLESRAHRIFSDLDAHLSPASSFSSTDTDMSEGPRDIPWAAQSLSRCVSQIKTLIAHTENPLSPRERSSATRALIRILRGVVDRKDLRDRLVKDGFVADSLELLVDQTQYVDEIQDIMASISHRGAPASWMAKMDAVLARMRNNRRTSTTSTRAPRASKQRVASPATGPAERGESGETGAVGLGILGYGASSGAQSASVSTSASTTGTSVRFLDPETPITAAHAAATRGGGRGGRGRGGQQASTTAGGSVGGAGFKRSGGGTPSERGSKRAR